MPDKTETITEPDHLKRVIDDLMKAPRVALDIESDGFYNYRDQVCIVTLSDEKRDYVVDTIALGEAAHDMQRMVNREDVPLLMHSGQNDVLALKREYGFDFGLVHDTAVAAMLLGLQQTGLAALVEGYLGISLEKELQRYDWSRRPIEREHVRYLINDTRHLFEIHDRIEAELREHELLDEYHIECRAVAEAEPRPRDFDPERFRRIKGHGKLSNEQRGALKALYAWRDEVAGRLNRAPFRVTSDSSLLALARVKADSARDLEQARGIGDWLIREYSDEILETVRRGLADPAPVRPPRKKDPNTRRMDPKQRDRLGRLKRWREQEAERRGLGLQAILPTAALKDLIFDPPTGKEELARADRVGENRAERYGEEILRILSS